MTNTDSATIIYNYFDKVTCTIMDRWATTYMEEHNCTYDHALVVVMCQIFSKEGKKA